MFQMNKDRAIQAFFRILCEDNPCVRPDYKTVPDDLVSMADHLAEYYILEMTPAGQIPRIHRATNIPQQPPANPDARGCSRPVGDS